MATRKLYITHVAHIIFLMAALCIALEALDRELVNFFSQEKGSKYF